MSEFSIPKNSHHLILPVHDTPIIEMYLGKGIGTIIFDNDILYQIHPRTLHLIHHTSCSKTLRFFSENACSDWCNGEYWEEALSKVERVNFFGIWHKDVLQLMVMSLKSVRRISLVYWKCIDMLNIIERIPSQNLEEFVAHVNGTKNTIQQVITALNHMGTRNQSKALHSLMLISSETLPDYDPAETFFNLIPIPSNDTIGKLGRATEVIILYGSEGRCMRTLETQGYTKTGWARMATNDPRVEDHTIKEFESFVYYEKTIGGIVFTIGCRQGRHFHQNLIYDHHHQCQPTNIDFSKGVTWKFPVYEAHKEPHIQFHQMNKEEMQEYRSYDKLREDKEAKRAAECPGCREPRTPYDDPQGKAWRTFGIPAFEHTSIQRVIYGVERTEYQLSHGLYVTIFRPGNDTRLMKTFMATERFTVHFLDQRRHRVIPQPYTNFLRRTKYIHFEGRIWSVNINDILAYCPSKTSIINMVNMKADRNELCGYLAQLQHPGSIRYLNYDARDTIEDGMASIVYAVNYCFGVRQLEGLYLIARKMIHQSKNKKHQFIANLPQVIRDLEMVITLNAVVTLVLCEETFSSAILEENHFRRIENCLFPRMFSERQYTEDDCALMTRFVRFDKNGRVWYLILPLQAGVDY